MSVKYEQQEHNLVKMTIEIPFEDIDKAMDQEYNKNRSKIVIPGFRKGRAPRAMVERVYGKDIFLEDAFNEILPDLYEKACKEIEEEAGIKLVSYPQIEVEKLAVGEAAVVHATVAKKPEVKLGEYKGLEVEKETVEVTDEDIEAELKKEQEKNAAFVPVEDRPVADGDMIKLDYSGRVDGELFDGGTAQDQDLTIGSGQFVPGFEEQLIGMNIGETKDITVTFPENYHEGLAGKEAVFTCTINSIKKKELPELDDEFASEVSDFETLDEYKADLKTKLTEQKQTEADSKLQQAALEKAIENAEIDLPELLVESEARNAVQDFANRLASSGLTMDMYMQYSGLTEQQMIDNEKENARKNLLGRLVLEAVAEAEGLESTDEDVDAEFEKMAGMYGMEKDQLRSYSDDAQIEQMKAELVNRKALELIAANVK